MIKIENVNVVRWKEAIRGMRNPMNSWNRSDTVYILNVLSLSNCGLLWVVKRNAFAYSLIFSQEKPML